MKCFCMLTLIALSANLNLYAAAASPKTSAIAAARRATFVKARGAIINNQPVTFMDIVDNNPGIQHHIIDRCSADDLSGITQECHVDLLKAAIGTLQVDRTFYVEQLLKKEAKLKKFHIASCALVIEQKASSGTIDPALLTNLQMLFFTIAGRTIEKIPAQKVLQEAICDVARAKRSQISNIPALLASVKLDIYALDKK